MVFVKTLCSHILFYLDLLRLKLRFLYVPLVSGPIGLRLLAQETFFQSPPLKHHVPYLFLHTSLLSTAEGWPPSDLKLPVGEPQYDTDLR